MEILAAVAVAALLWWFLTGVIFYLDGLPKRTYFWSLGAATLIATCSLIGLMLASRSATVGGAYATFGFTLLIWGWQEMLFLMGAIAGPSRQSCPPNASERQRFTLATRAVIYHELALFGGGLLLLAFTWGAVNQVGGYTYLVLWIMRLSAKLNLFFGVRNTYSHFLPPHMAYLGTYFRQTNSIGKFFTVSVAMATACAATIWVGVGQANLSPFATTGMVLVATLLTLAVLEHLFLIAPRSVEALWSPVLGHRVEVATPNIKS